MRKSGKGKDPPQTFCSRGTSSSQTLTSQPPQNYSLAPMECSPTNGRRQAVKVETDISKQKTSHNYVLLTGEPSPDKLLNI